MIDYFAMLKEPRRPWLDEESLRVRFLELSAEVHPDRVHEAAEAVKRRANDRYAELNSAYSCLREPKCRLQHLFELESGAKPKEVQQIPPGTMELFVAVGQLCREVDGFLAQRATVTSPLVKVEMFEKAQDWIEQVKELHMKLRSRCEQFNVELQKLNRAWETAPTSGPARLSALPMQELEHIGRQFSYLTRWTGQLQERLVQLSF